MNQQNSKNNDFLFWLESLRGLACILVVIHHYFFSRALFGCLDIGNIGVVIFFLISGHIVTKTCLNKDKGYIKKFIYSRAARLYPAYLISVVIAWAVYQPNFFDTIVNLTMFQTFIGVNNVNGVYWSLQVELVFYILLVVFLYFGGVNKNKTLISLFFAIAINIAFGAVRYFFEKRAPSSLSSGISFILISAYFAISDNKKDNFYIFLLFYLFVVVFSNFLSYSKDWGYHVTPISFIVSNTLGIFIFFTVKETKHVLGNTFNFLGRISFSLYLIHQPIKHAIDQFLPEPISIIYSLICSLALSYILFIFIENKVTQHVKERLKLKPIQSTQM